LVLANLLWSGNYIGGRVLAAAMPALLLNGIRWTVSALILLGVVRLSGRRVPFREEWPRLLLLGLVGMFAFSSLTYLGLHSIGAARAGLISGIIPVAVVFFGALVARDRPSAAAVGGAALAVGGVALLLGGGARAAVAAGTGRGELLILLAALAWGLYTALGRRYADRLDPLVATAGAAVFGAVPSLAAGLAVLPGHPLRMTPPAWAALAYVSTAASVLAYWAWTTGVGAVGPARAAAFINLLPVFTVLLGVVLLHERLGWSALVGGAVIFGGAALAQWRRRATPTS
jgi:drug/metabolite transporter (DMT)-like permease